MHLKKFEQAIWHCLPCSSYNVPEVPSYLNLSSGCLLLCGEKGSWIFELPEKLIFPLYIWGRGWDAPYCAVFRSVWLLVCGHLTDLSHSCFTHSGCRDCPPHARQLFRSAHSSVASHSSHLSDCFIGKSPSFNSKVELLDGISVCWGRKGVTFCSYLFSSERWIWAKVCYAGEQRSVAGGA